MASSATLGSPSTSPSNLTEGTATTSAAARYAGISSRLAVPHQVHGVGDSELMCLARQSLALVAVPDEHEPKRGQLLDGTRVCRDQVLESLHAQEAADPGDDDVIGLEAETPADGGACVRSGSERVDVGAVRDSLECAARAKRLCAVEKIAARRDHCGAPSERPGRKACDGTPSARRPRRPSRAR